MDDVIKTDEFLQFVEENANRTWIFLDTETLGFNPDKHQLTEVAAKSVRFSKDRFRDKSYYHQKAKLLSSTRLRMSYPYRGNGMSYQQIMQMTNYGEPIKGQPYIDEEKVVKGILQFIRRHKNPLLLAHNSSFDIRYLNGRANIYMKDKNPFDEYEVVDTLKIMKKYFTALVATESKRTKHRWLSEKEKQHILEMRRIRGALQKNKKKRMSLKLGIVAESLGINADGWHSAKYDVETLISTMEKVLALFRESSGKTLYSEKHFL